MEPASKFPVRSDQQANTSLSFVARRHPPELIPPATPTPRELKPLSDIDDQDGLRYMVSNIQFYRRNPNMGNKDPASVIKDALAKILVFYYPLAGRLKEGPGRKLTVDCSGQGALFIEADADVTLEQFGKTCMGELLCDVPGFNGVVDSPLVQMQVTPLLCGGFILTSRMSHTMCDGVGAGQFITGLGEMAQGSFMPSILPVWQRDLLYARDPPQVTFPHPEYDDNKDNIITGEMTQRSFYFGPAQMSALRRFVPDNLKSCSTFEVLTACLWCCRTIALQPNPEKDMHLMFFVNARTKFNPHIPIGYYGNCIVIPCVTSKVKDLCNKTLSHALELIIKAKSSVTEEYVRSTTDLMFIKERPHFRTHSTFIVSNLTRAGFNKVNFGWGKPLFAGVPYDDKDLPGVYSLYMPSTNDNGETGITAIIGLPISVMDKFVKEINILLE
ncbi:hypothetical protein R6Q57_010499 [Mikania cordata]